VIASVFDHAEARDPMHARTWVVLVDGARHQLDLIRGQAARRRVRIRIVIDLIHVLEYLWKAAWCLHAADDPAAEDWVATQALAILAGHARHAAATIDAQATTAGLSGDRRAGVNACVRYLTSNAAFLRYDQAIAAGWPIATGVIEGACRHLIGDRLDITGARWGLDGAEAILTLRAVISNGDFDDYWGYHLAQEHQRLYPGTTQGQSLRVTLSLTPNEPHTSSMAATAARMASIAAAGWDTIDTCDPAISVIVAPARSAMLRWVAGGMTRSSVPTTAQLGMVFQAAVWVGAVFAPSVIGR
jgi:hypothetical protein